ncbi:hypothetical protein GW17_00038400 [Ensete ventricosum]|nr:hypothetical protein GW17_00038400 [Ensete ventricosum]
MSVNVMVIVLNKLTGKEWQQILQVDSFLLDYLIGCPFLTLVFDFQLQVKLALLGS